jgi:hypothetical protein
MKYPVILRVKRYNIDYQPYFLKGTTDEIIIFLYRIYTDIKIILVVTIRAEP